MKVMKIKSLLILSAVTGIIFILLSSCRVKNPEDVIIFTRISVDPPAGNLVTGESWRYFPGSAIAAFNPHKPSKSPEILTGDFFSACAPEISCDGEKMVFAGQKTENDKWQIFEMDLSDYKTRQITSSDGTCIDPVYLPGSKVVFSMLSTDDSLKAGHSLYTCNPDGSDLRRLTFSPNTYFASDILKDGRILTISRQLYPEVKDQIFIVLRPDGTKAEMFYGTSGKDFLLSRAREAEDGRIYFVKSEGSGSGNADLMSVSYNRPLHSEKNLTGNMEGEFRSVYPEASGKLLVSYRESASDNFAIFEFDPETQTLGKEIIADSRYNIIDAVTAQPRLLPRKLPSEVDMMVKTGLIMCQDINITDHAFNKSESRAGKATSVEILGLDSSLGIVEASPDGSFYLKVKADIPFRIQTLDEKGKVISGPCDWIWLRPNERRGCVGCHEDHEQAPENRIPLAVKKFPVVLPVHIEKIKDKTVELE